MIYLSEDKHPIINAIKEKGWIVFEVYGNRTTEKNGLSGGWWIDTNVTFETDHYTSHRIIHNKYLGGTLKDALKEVKGDNFPTNVL